MNREEKYQEWQSQRMSDGTKLCDKETIKKCRKMSDENFWMFAKYVDSIIEDSSFKGRRSKVTDFFVYLSEENILFKNITQNDVDDYFILCKEKGNADKTITSRADYLKSLCKFYEDELLNKIDFDKHRIKKKDMKIINPMKALTISQLEHCRKLYENDLEKLYVIEMFYETGCTVNVLAKLSYDKFSPVERSFYLGKKEIKVSQNLTNIIEQIKETKIMEANYYIETLLEKMKKELSKIGIDNLNPQDLKETRKDMMFMCPQCKKSYEAIVENWCGKQFREDGSFWIICRKCGEEI